MTTLAFMTFQGYISLVLKIQNLAERMMPMIDITFDTYKALTMRRATEAVSYDDVIRDLLKLPPANPPSARENSENKKAWAYRGANLPHGTALRANYKGTTHIAHIADGEWIQDGSKQTSPSAAAFAITNNSVNGWDFWEARLPGEDRWRLLSMFR